jgi:predicted RND superfamily exporter protein
VITVSVVFAFNLRNLKTGVHVNNMFVDRHEIIISDRWLEKHIGPMASIEIVVEVPVDGTNESFQNSLRPVQSIAEHLIKTQEFGSVLSAATGLPDVYSMPGLRGVAARVRLAHWLRDSHERFCSSGFYAETSAVHLWRISARIPAMTDIPTSTFCEQLSIRIDQFLVDYRMRNPESPAELSYYVTGLPLLLEQVEQQFVRDLLVTYAGGLIMITIVVLIVLRSISDGVMVMIPNVLPAVGVLGGLSMWGIELDVGSVMTASIALGVAVDDTLHFVLWYQRQRHQGNSSREAVRSAILHCGSPILHTSIICGVGISILALASFIPFVRFGLLIAMMLGVALIGDLILLPAMLSRKA